MSLEQEDKKIILENLAADYAKYFQVETSKQKKELDYELETVLAQFEEYKVLVNESQTANRDLLENQVPKIFSYYQALQRSFQSIDNLENLVNDLKTDVATLEDSVAKAERTLKVGPSISTVFKPFLFMKEPLVLSSPSPEDLQFPPQLKFDVDKYFPRRMRLLDKELFLRSYYCLLPSCV